MRKMAALEREFGAPDWYHFPRATIKVKALAAAWVERCRFVTPSVTVPAIVQGRETCCSRTSNYSAA